MTPPVRGLVAALALLCGMPGAALAAPAVAPILMTTDSVDDRTWAQPRIARVTHADLDLVTDFETKVVSGTAALDVLAAPGAAEIVLDTWDLTILSVTNSKGGKLPWTLGAADGDKGAPLTVQLNGERRIIVSYRSGSADALQWLPPQLTAGKARPFLYSQGQATLNRSWIPTQDSPGIRQT